jgi:D-alanine transaminase
MSLAYLNGEYLPIEDAKVSVLDRGFLFGDGVYEVIPFYCDKGLGLHEHLQRLEQSLAAIEITSPLSTGQWQTVFEKLLSASDAENNGIYFQITRGAPPARIHAFPGDEVKPTVFAFAMPLTKGKLNAGIKTITREDMRWKNCFIKSLNLLPNCMANQTAVIEKANETIFIEDDFVTEGSSSNVFIVKDGTVSTTPATSRILNGITRRFVLKILHELSIPVKERAISQAELENADEIWVTSSTREIAPVIQLNELTISNGKPGKLWQQVYPAYMALTK